MAILVLNDEVRKFLNQQHASVIDGSSVAEGQLHPVIDPATEAYALSLTRNPSYLSNTMNQAKPFEIAGDLVYRLMQGDLKIGKPKLGSKFEFGLAIGTLDGKNCVLMIAK